MPRWGRAALIVLVCVSAFLAAAPAGAQTAPADPAARALADAQAAYTRGDVLQALDLLRKLRTAYPGSPVLPRALGLMVQYSLTAGDEYAARYYYGLLHDGFPASGESFSTAIVLARHFYDARSWDTSLLYFRAAVDSWRAGAGTPRTDFDAALLHAAEISLYHAGDAPGARAFLARTQVGSFSGQDATLYRQMRMRLLWSVLDPDALGLKDANISSLRADGDDLWVGTWNGGVSRYAASARRADPFPGPAFSRSIEVADRRVWVGTTEGLAWYGKGTGRWTFDDAFGGDDPAPVQVVRRIAGDLYAGTLGKGLFRLGEAGWAPVSDGDLPGLFITSLAEDASRHRLLIGTMNRGVVILDLAAGTMTDLADLVPDFTSANVTSVLAASDGRVWIGTYGEGLVVWAPQTGAMTRYTKAGGQIGDDWVLCSAETDRGLYFGTFGGGVSFLSRSGTWRRIGIGDGLASLDVTAIEWRPPWLYFGTLGAGVSVYDEASDGAQP